MTVDQDALNYPYIRVRSADWLKRTLLLFPHVVRMSPRRYAPADDPEIADFVWQPGQRGEPLLRSAELWAPPVQAAQRQLILDLEAMFEARGESFLKSLQRKAYNQEGKGEAYPHLTVWERRLGRGKPSFQIHTEKVAEELGYYLRNRGLAWEPDLGHGPSYLEMNPKLGEAVMATLAMACAKNEGLRVVTEFPGIHGRLLGTPQEDVLKATFDDQISSGKTSANQVAEFLVYRRCDVTKLTAKRISALKSERDALSAFRSQLEKLAATLPPTLQDEPKLEARLNDLLNDVFRDWKRDQANLSNYAKQIFGEGMLTEPEKLIGKLVENITKPETGAGFAAGASIAPHIGGLTLDVAQSAAAGFVVAVVFRSVGAWSKLKGTEKNSPYRYLTQLQDQGVSFSLTA